jgi:hypothetical protein
MEWELFLCSDGVYTSIDYIIYVTSGKTRVIYKQTHYSNHNFSSMSTEKEDDPKGNANTKYFNVSLP